MSRVIEMVLPDQLVTDVQPMLVQGGMDLKDYILEAVTWYTRYLRQVPERPFGFAQGMPGMVSYTFPHERGSGGVAKAWRGGGRVGSLLEACPAG